MSRIFGRVLVTNIRISSLIVTVFDVDAAHREDSSVQRSTGLSFRTLPVLTLLVLLMSGMVPAQLAPTGSHYAGRASDTGHGGSMVSVTGGFGASIPLDLPTARTGLPIPLQIVYGGRSVGAAGLGWDIPLNSVDFSPG